jgi:hypothetical protein
MVIGEDTGGTPVMNEASRQVVPGFVKLWSLQIILLKITKSNYAPPLKQLGIKAMDFTYGG